MNTGGALLPPSSGQPHPHGLLQPLQKPTSTRNVTGMCGTDCARPEGTEMGQARCYAKPQRGSWCPWWGCAPQPIALAYRCVGRPEPTPTQPLTPEGSETGWLCPVLAARALTSRRRSRSQSHSPSAKGQSKNERVKQGTGVSKEGRAFFQSTRGKAAVIPCTGHRWAGGACWMRHRQRAGPQH